MAVDHCSASPLPFRPLLCSHAPLLFSLTSAVWTSTVRWPHLCRSHELHTSADRTSHLLNIVRTHTHTIRYCMYCSYVCMYGVCTVLFIRMRVRYCSYRAPCEVRPTRARRSRCVRPTLCFRMYGIVHTNPRTVLFIRRMRVRHVRHVRRCAYPYR